MDDIKKERLVISVSTLAGIACIIQNFVCGWDFWVPVPVTVILITLWWFHFTEKPDINIRINLCFAFSAFLVFYHGIHESSLYEVSVATALFLVSFMIFDRILLLDIIFAEYAVIMTIQLVFLSGSNAFIDNMTRTKIGFHIFVTVSLFLFCRITVKRNLAEKEAIQKWLSSSKKNDHDMEDFLSNISHELRTPVNVISGMAALMKNNNDSSELTSIQKAVIRLSHQIEDIQDYTEIKRNEILLEEENYTCASLINDAISNYRADDNKNGLELVVDLDPNIPAMLKGDVKKLHKILRHLLENGVNFTKRGGVFIKISYTPQEYGINLTIDVKDTGIGMTRADIAGVSMGMYQANKKRNRSTGGIGTGLPIVYGFVHKMGGFVNINSVKGNGTSVHVCIPQQVVDPSPSLSINEESEKTLVFYNKPEKYKVPEVREFYRDMLTDLSDGLKINLYQISDGKKLRQLSEDGGPLQIFTQEEEYRADQSLLEELSQKGCRVCVASIKALDLPSEKNILNIPKPLYAFPIVRVLNGEDILASHEEEGRGKMTFTGVSALIVDDEPMNLVVAEGLLREYRMFSDTAESGREAIEKYEKGSYDVIFMDHMMPEMDGVETQKYIRQIAEANNKKPVIIALTANVLSGARQMFIKEGFDGFIAKPIDIREFERVMKNTLADDMIHYEGRDE